MKLKLYADIEPIKGYCRSILYDFGRGTHWYVPNSFLKLVDKNLCLKYAILKEQYSEYLNFLNENNLVFTMPKILIKSFPKVKYDFFSYSLITNIVIEMDYNKDTSKIISDINLLEKKLYCYNYIFILNESLDLWADKIKTLMDNIMLENVVAIGIKGIVSTENQIINFLEKNKNINSLFLIENTAKTTKFKCNYNSTIIYSIPPNLNQGNCVVNFDLFSINLTLFNESQKYNTYFNRKLFIGINGEIKNSPETPTVFGNINELENTENILKIIESNEFQKYWYVHKGIIDVCKQCEFRHMCVDNRIPIQRNEKDWYFKTECNYNPYIAKWKDEDGYKTLEECGIQSNANGFKLNRKKLNAINKVLWGDD